MVVVVVVVIIVVVVALQLLVQQELCGSLPGHIFVETKRFEKSLTRQACGSLPGQKLFEPLVSCLSLVEPC